jgi:paraquat-inducible protein B
MADDPQAPGSEIHPTPRIKAKRWIPSLVWSVPIAAALVGLSLVVNAWRTAGPRITITFPTAEGLEVGKTLVKYRNVTIGRVTGVTLTEDHDSVLVTADLAKSAQDIATADTKFWVVRPRLGVGWVSGLDTLLSGAFIGAEAGESKTPRRQFVGLDAPPALAHASMGKRVVLHSTDLGSVSLGAPVYFRRLQVGRVIDEALEPDGTGAQLVLFIDAPNDRFVTGSTRFWNASGIDVTLSANGLKLKTQSLASVLAGGIAFESVPAPQGSPVASPPAQFTLYKDEASAMAPADGNAYYVRMRFAQSLRGLSVGAPVEFVGVNIGAVTSIDLDYIAKDQSFPVVVTALLYPHRMGRAYDTLVQQGGAESNDKMARLVGQLVVRGLRAQPRPASLLTGQLYLALDFMPRAPKAHFDQASMPLEIPTIRGSIDELQLRLASIVDKLDQLPLSDIGRHLDIDLTDVHETLGHVERDTLPTAAATLSALHDTLSNVDHTLASDSPLRESIERTLSEAQRAMGSVRSLSDYLNRHPESLVRGRRPAGSDKSVSTSGSDATP